LRAAAAPEPIDEQIQFLHPKLPRRSGDRLRPERSFMLTSHGQTETQLAAIISAAMQHRPSAGRLGRIAGQKTYVYG
jgi:hypothetical protein